MTPNENGIDYFAKDYHRRNDSVVYNDRILTVPNILTLSRLIGLPFLIWFINRIDRFGPVPALILGSCMLLSDILDGILARALRQISLVGAIMDPVVDKLIINSLAVYLVFRGWLPVWAIVVIVLRDLAILVFGLRIFLNYGTLVTPIIIGRITPLTWGIVFIAAIMDIELLKWILLPIAIILTIISGILYYQRYKDLLSQKKQGG